MSSITTITATSLLILFALTVSSVHSSAVLIADFSMSRMIELSARYPFCRLHRDRGDIQRMLLSADPRRIRQVPRESVMALEGVCHDTGSLNGGHQGGLGFIYPGTKWCGPGSLAADYSDLGRYADEDRCCREHDLCPNTLAPGECRRGLCNTGSFTRSHCDCDARFRRCLQSLNTETANTLGAVFFNVVQVTCFRERSPCSVWQRSGYEYENTCPSVFQPSDIYIPPNDKFIQKLINKNKISRSLNVENNSKFNEFQDTALRLGVRVSSIGLIARNVFKNTVVGPVFRLLGKSFD